jgi:hypothetical protein
MGLFDLINKISHSKDVSDVTDKDIDVDYVPFVVNKTLSYHPDSLIYANEMNQRQHADKQLQFQFYLNSLRPRKRFAKWVKAEKVDNLEAVKLSFNYSNEKALQIIDLLSDEQINEIIKDRTGGVEK